MSLVLIIICLLEIRAARIGNTDGAAAKSGDNDKTCGLFASQVSLKARSLNTIIVRLTNGKGCVTLDARAQTPWRDDATAGRIDACLHFNAECAAIVALNGTTARR